MKYKEPVLICPGVIKSGTTFLYEILAKSPKLSVAKNKEVHFFSYALENSKHMLKGRRASVTKLQNKQSIEDYLINFTDNKGILCDISPSYLGHPLFSDRVASFLEQPYFVVTTRNRLSRAKSSYIHARRVGLEKNTFFQAVYRDFKDQDPSELPLKKYYQFSDYDVLISKLINRFGEERVRRLHMHNKIKSSEIIKNVEDLLGLELFENKDFIIKNLEANKSMSIGENQRIVKWIFDRPKIASQLSKTLPKSHKFRRYVSKLLYRGNSVEIDPLEEKKVEQLLISEFGSL